MKNLIFILVALLIVTPTVYADAAADKAAAAEAKKKAAEEKRKAEEIARKKRDLEKRIKQIEWKRNGAAKALQDRQNQWVRNTNCQAQATQRIAKAEENLKNALKRRDELKRVYQDRANDKQLADADLAAKKQLALNATIDILRKTLEEDVVELQKLQKEKFEDNELVKQDAQQKTMSEAFELAKKLEQEITESFKDLKATQTAIIHKMSFNAAQKITDVAKPERIEVDKKILESKPRNKEDLDKQKEVQKEMIVETDKMVEATVAMMEEAMEIVLKSDDQPMQQAQQKKEIRWLEEKDFENPTMKERLEEMTAEADFQVVMDQAAAEDDKQKMKDLAAMMSQMNADKQEKKEEKKEEDKQKAAEAIAKQMQKAAEGAKDSKPPALDAKNKDLFPGNVMQVAGEPKEGVTAGNWMYVSSWYVIGPFPNPNRINLRRKFPPESVVDLNATYAGKDGKLLRWVYTQAKNKDTITHWGANMGDASEVIPDDNEEYAIYYAYAEVFFDQECDRWIAIGSDDRSDVWINDFHVWGSSNKLKGWRLNEDYRRVHFQKGRNKILLRCENGHWNLGWSMCIATGEGKTELKSNIVQ